MLAWFLSEFPKYDEYKEFFADKVEKTPAANQIEAAEPQELPIAS